MKWVTPDYEEIKLGPDVTDYVDTDPGEALLETSRFGASPPTEDRELPIDRVSTRVQHETRR